MYWNDLRHAVDVARDQLFAALDKMDSVDADPKLTATGKADKRKEIAEREIAVIKSTKALDKARASIERATKRWDEQAGLTPKPAAEEAAVLSEIRAHIASMEGSKVAFVVQNVDDPRVVAAVLGGPAFLSGLTTSEIDIIKGQIVKHNAPQIFELREATAKALAETESGWRNALNQIGQRGGLKGKNGTDAAE